jgi:hypothetical protein
MTFGDNLILKKKEDVIERSGDELLLFDSSTGKLLEVNETGKTIWSMLNGEHTIKEIKDKLITEFEDVKDLNRDLKDFLNKLLEMDLIEKL